MTSMADDRTLQRPKPLPRALRPDAVGKMALGCRFGWHQWVWGETSPGGCYQRKTCMKCGRVKEAMV